MLLPWKSVRRSVSAGLWRFWMITMVYTLPARTMHSIVWTGSRRSTLFPYTTLFRSYVTCPDDAQYRLDWIKDIYTPDMNNDYVYPNVFMSNEDTEQVSNLQADLQTYMNTQKANWIMNGTTDAEWNEYLSKLEDYGLSDYLGIMQKYLDAYYA